MRRVLARLSWIRHPQIVLGFVVLCLCVGALGDTMRSAAAWQPGRGPHVAAAATVLPAQGTSANCTVKPCIALTFDDGPDPVMTPAILDALARQQVPATFFVVGNRIAGNEALLKRVYAEGHEIGNHSWSHPDLSKLPPEGVEEQLRLTQRAVAMAGVPVPRILRPPYGAVDPMVAAHNSLAVIRWNVDPEDWKVQDPAKLTEHMIAHARPGAIILLHDLYPSTVAALEPTLQTLKQTYQFVTASQLLNLSPGDQGQYFGR